MTTRCLRGPSRPTAHLSGDRGWKVLLLAVSITTVSGYMRAVSARTRRHNYVVLDQHTRAGRGIPVYSVTRIITVYIQYVVTSTGNMHASNRST